MKSQFTPLYFLLLLAFFLVSNSVSPPDGRTGAPEDGTCTNCHAGDNPNNIEGTLEILGLPDDLAPNTTYSLIIRATRISGNPMRAGFQMVALDADNANAGNFANAGPSSSLTNKADRIYFGHKPALRFEDQEEVTWTVDWTAPEEVGTAITFYANSVFGNGSSSNDDFSLPITVQKSVASFAAPISVSVDAESVSCAGANDGRLALQVEGGTGAISYEWSNGMQEAIIENVAAGDYSVTITDEAGSLTSTTFRVPEPEAIQISVLDITDIDCNNAIGFATVLATGGLPDYRYEWSDIQGSSVSLAEGVHEVTVTDRNGCTQTTSITIEKNLFLPQVNAGPSKIVDCTGPIVDLEGSASEGDQFTYLWTSSTGNILIGERTLNPTIETGGLYTLLVTNTTTGCSASSQVEVVENRTAPIANAGVNKPLSCAEEITRLDGLNSSTGDNFEYEWTTNDGNITNGVNTLTPSVTQSGTYNLRVVDTSNGCFSSANVSVIQDVNMPTAVAGESQTFDCNTMQLTLNGNGSTGVDFVYSWETEDGKIDNGENTLTPIISAPGTYRLTVRNRTNGCDANSSVVIMGEQGVEAIAGGDIKLSCNSSSITTLNGDASSSGDNITYEWTTQDGNIVSGETVSIINVDQPGTYTLRVKDKVSGCEDIDQIMVILEEQAPELSFVETAEINCKNPTISLQASVSTNTENLSIQWQSVDGNILEGESTLTPIVNEPGIYSLSVFDKATNCFSSAMITVTKSEDALTVDIDDTKKDGAATANVIGGTPPYAYIWDTVPLETDATIMNMPNGKYSVTVTDANGCSSIATAVIVGSTSVPLISSLTSIEVYPNPTYSGIQLNASFNTKEIGSIRLFNSLGRQIWQQPFDTNTIQTRIATKQWEGGVYYLMLQTAEGVKVEEVILLD